MYDPSVIDPELEKHVPELREIVKGIRQVMPNGVDVSTPARLAEVRAAQQAASAAEIAAALEAGTIEPAEERGIPGPAGDVRVRILRPPEIRAVYLHIHGGGWTIGEPEMNEIVNWSLARAARVAVVSVDYRLAPEHPYPAAPDDCEAAASWLLEHAEREFGTPRLLIGGESAGGHLSAVTLLRVRDRHRAIDRFEGANLVYGCYDMSLTPSQRDPRDTPILSHRDIQQMPDYFLPGYGPEERRAPDISPLFADLHGLPPALFTVGTDDRLLDDTLFMAARWHAAGNRTELALYPEAPHGFSLFPMGMATAAHARANAFLADIASGGGG